MWQTPTLCKATNKSTIHLGGATHKESEENMRKIFAIILVVLLIAAMSVPAFAVTPRWEYKPVKLPQIKPDTSFVQGAVANWFKTNTIKISFTMPVLN